MLLRVGHHAVTERRKTGTASGLVEVESHDFNRGSVSKDYQYFQKEYVNTLLLYLLTIPISSLARLVAASLFPYPAV